MFKDQKEFIPLQVTPIALDNHPGALYAEVITARGTQVRFYKEDGSKGMAGYP